MRITPGNSFKGRHYSGEVILLAMRWYLQYPLAYEHVAEMLAEQGLAVDASWRWVQAYAPELNKLCRPHLRPTNKSYRIDETMPRVMNVDQNPRLSGSSRGMESLGCAAASRCLRQCKY